jgi:carbonic anhydrase
MPAFAGMTVWYKSSRPTPGGFTVTDRVSRRRLLRGAVALAGVAACPLCRSAAADEWGYRGEHGPAHWGQLKPEFQACSSGTMQTPIDLRAPATGAADAVKRDYRTMPLALIHNGHTVQVNAAPGSGATIDGVRFELVQFHFHHPSEHLLSGEAATLEVHFVHRNAAGQLAVLGVFLEADGKPLAALEPIWAALPEKAGPARTVTGVTIAPERLFPAGRSHFRYQGSLTTPPCSEGVDWVVYAEPVEISRAQGARFARLFPINARPVQPLNGRSLGLAG